jgi:hypothetical protein
MRRRRSSGEGHTHTHTHTHTPDTGGRERNGIVSQTRSPTHRAHGAPSGQESSLDALGDPRYGPQQCAARR